jgi:hypothetical protein
MPRVYLAFPLAIAIAAPAGATGSLICRTAGAHPIEVGMVISHTAISAVVQARLNDGGRDVPVHIAQAWLESDEVRLDLEDPNAERVELKLRAKGKGEQFDGSIWRGGRRHWVRCVEG